MASADEEALIGRLRNAFAQNIKPRSGAAVIRSNIAENVNSYIIFDEHEEALPLQVKSPGKEVTGLRRRYLDALEANVEARERCQRLNINIRDRLVSQSQRSNSASDVVLSHLEASGLRKQHQELAIRSRYIRSLSQDASASSDLEIPLSEQRNAIKGNSTGDVHIDIAAVEAEVTALTSNLQKAVLQAEYQLERQNALLNQVKHAQANTDSGLTRPQSRAKAVAATREVLITWLDEKLSESGADHTEKAVDSHMESNGASSEPPPSIVEHYQNYLDVRKATIEAADEAVRPLAALSNGEADEAESIIEKPYPSSDNLSTAHAIIEHVAPLLRQQAGMATFQSYLLAQKTRKRKDTLDVLERLAHESHLLSTYPAGTLNYEDELTRSVAAWTSSACAASDSALKAIEQYERAGQQAVTNGEDGLDDLKALSDDHETSSSKMGGIGWKGMHGKLGNDETL